MGILRVGWVTRPLGVSVSGVSRAWLPGVMKNHRSIVITLNSPDHSHAFLGGGGLVLNTMLKSVGEAHQCPNMAIESYYVSSKLLENNARS
jgi:hypothetical protein